MKIKFFYAIVCLLVMIGCQRAAKSQQSSTASMPDFTFYTLGDSLPFTKANIEEGKKSIVILFDVSCSHCQDEIASIGKRFGEFQDVNFYLVSFDDKNAIQRFMASYGKVLNGKSNVRVLQDSAHEFIPKFQPTKYPALYVYSEKKTLIKYFAGESEVGDIIAAAK